MLLEDGVGDRLTVVAALSGRGYFVLTTVFESSEYGTPMARRRTYLVALAMAILKYRLHDIENNYKARG